MSPLGSIQVLETRSSLEAVEKMKRKTTISQKSVNRTIDLSSTHFSPFSIDKSRQTSHHENTCLSTSGMTNKNNTSVSEGFNSHTAFAEVALQNTIRQREHDLMCLVLQTGNASVHGDDIDATKEFIEKLSLEQILACPIHAALFSQLDDIENNNPKSNQETAQMPMERYLLEGLAERYALASVDQSDTGGDWAKYSDCRCGHHWSGV